jgi:hypothetical protein
MSSSGIFLDAGHPTAESDVLVEIKSGRISREVVNIILNRSVRFSEKRHRELYLERQVVRMIEGQTEIAETSELLGRDQVRVLVGWFGAFQLS